MEKLRSISIGRARAGSMFTVRGVNGEELGYSDKQMGPIRYRGHLLVKEHHSGYVSGLGTRIKKISLPTPEPKVERGRGDGPSSCGVIRVPKDGNAAAAHSVHTPPAEKICQNAHIGGGVASGDGGVRLRAVRKRG